MILCQGCELSVTVEVTIARLTVFGSEIVPGIVRHHLPSVVVQVGKAVVAMGAKAATLGESVNQKLQRVILYVSVPLSSVPHCRFFV